MKRIFADTFYWIALTHPEDASHKEVRDVSQRLAPHSVITTDEVLGEFLAYSASRPYLRRLAGRVVSGLLTDPDTLVVPQSRSSFEEGLALFNARPDKGYSLTDCISMATMRREHLAEALTNDRHFEQEGFRAVFRL